TFPMNESAIITNIKAAAETKGDFNEELTEIQLQDAGYQMFCALRYALSSATWSELTKDEKVTLAEVIIQQFSDAYMAYFPAYIDLLTEMYGGMETWAAKKLETKAGRTFSAANREKIQDIANNLLALIADDAGTSEEEAATSPTKAAAPKPEPDSLHSAAEILNGIMRTL